MLTRFAKASRGTTAVTFAAMAPFMLGAFGIVSDSATFVMKRNSLQTIADAAALAAAKELAIASNGQAEIESVAQTAAATALGPGSPDAQVNVTVDRKESKVQVEVAEIWQPFFAHFIKSDVTPIKASATAMLAGSANICILSLDATASKALHMDKRAAVTAKGCGVFANSTHSQAIKLDEDSKVEAGMICAAGGVKAKSGAITPEPTSDCPPIPDPLAGRAPPPVGGCDHVAKIVALGNATLNPGTYCGGLTVTANAKVTLNPGTYVIKDGPLTVTLNGQLKGENVGFYLTGELSLIDFSKNSTIDLTGAKSGTMAGLLFFEDRNSSLLRMHWLNSANAHRLTGTIYLPNGYLRIDPNTPVAQDSEYTAIIANRVEVFEGPELILNADYESSDVPVPQGIRASAQVVLAQ